MQDTTPFADALEAAGKLTLPEQEELVDILHRRMIEQRRAEICQDVQDAEREFQAGGCRPVSPQRTHRRDSVVKRRNSWKRLGLTKKLTDRHGPLLLCSFQDCDPPARSGGRFLGSRKEDGRKGRLGRGGRVSGEQRQTGTGGNRGNGRADCRPPRGAIGAGVQIVRQPRS